MKMMGISEEAANQTSLKTMMRHFDYNDILEQVKANKQADA